MSIATWKRRYYPSYASNVKSDKGALIHALRKWKGLTPANLRKHNLSKTVSFRVIVDTKGDGFYIDGETCGLCHLHCKIECMDCPLQNERGGVPCDELMSEEHISPYSSFKDNNDPKPMIKLLTAALKTHIKKENA